MEGIRVSRRWLLLPGRLRASCFRAKSSQSSTLDYCVNVVRQHDYENFLATLLLDKTVRSPSLVVRAFNVEVARVQDMTTDNKTAEMRLQFWQDAVDLIFKKEQARQIPAHPIAQEIFYLKSTGHKLQKRHFEMLIRSRNIFLKTKYFRTLEEIEKYAEESVSTLFYIILNIANVQNVHADHAASHLGKAQGICNLLRSIYISNRQKTVTLPLDILTKHRVSQEDVLRSIDSQSMRDVSFELASRAQSHLQKARDIKVPVDAARVLLPAVAVHSYLQRLQRADFDVYNKTLVQRKATLPLLMYYNKLRRTF